MTTGGNPNPEQSPNNAWPRKPCPLCGKQTKRLPHHLRYEECGGMQ